VAAELAGKVALVTGGSRGIGRAIAVALAEAGADVAVNYTSKPDAAAEVVKQITSMGRKSKAYKANVGSLDEVKAMVAGVEADFGPIQILVNNAGINRDRTFMKMTPEAFKEVIDVNLTGAAMVTHCVLPKMTETNWGRVIFISSVNGEQGSFGQANYSAAKAGMFGLAKSLARELSRKNITVNCVAPGFTATDMTAGMPPEVLEKILATIPLGRQAKAEEVAHCVTFLASPQAAYITGETISVNGGLRM